MKKLFLLIFLLVISGISLAQPKQSGINFNSTYTALDSAGTWTGTKEYLQNNYNWAVITIHSDQAGTVKIAQSRAGVTFKSYSIFSYAAGDTVTNKFYVPITLDWILVSYANGPAAQTEFSLTTAYIIGTPLLSDANGIKVSGTFTIPTDTLRFRGSNHLYSSTVAAGDSIGSIIKLGLFQLPSLVYTLDTLKNIADTVIASYRYLKFYVLIGDSAGKSALSNWSLVSNTDSGKNDFQASLVKNKMTPLSPTVFYPFLSDPAAVANIVYIRPYVVGGIQKQIAIKLRTRNY